MCLSLIASALIIAGNVVLGIVGIVLTIVGILYMAAPEVLLPPLPEGIPEGLLDLGSVFVPQGSTLVFFGLAILLLAIVGACSGLCGGICRIVYSALLLVSLFALTVSIIYQSSHGGHTQFKARVQDAMEKNFLKYLRNKETVNGSSIKEPDEEEGNAWFKYQTQMSCCGVSGYEDFNGNVTISCCQLIKPAAINISDTGNITTGNYSNHLSCLAKNSTSYLNAKGCLDHAYAEISLGPQLATILSSLAMLLLAACLSLSTFLMG